MTKKGSLRVLCVVFVDFARLARKLFHKSNKKIYWRFFRLYLQRREEQNEKKVAVNCNRYFRSWTSSYVMWKTGWVHEFLDLTTGMKNGHVATLFQLFSNNRATLIKVPIYIEEIDSH